MTTEQRLFDFQYLSSVFAKTYAPYEWKRDRFGADIYNVQPWADRIRRAKDDLEYYEIAAEYVASLKDTHSAFSMNSVFEAYLPLTADLYDGKVLVDLIDRSALPESQYPLQIGDEVVSVDGTSTEDWIRYFSRFFALGWDRPTRRILAYALFYRPQTVFPRAHEIGAEARVQVRRRDGTMAAVSIPWIRFGTPIPYAGPVPSPRPATRGPAVPASAYAAWRWRMLEQEASVAAEEDSGMGPLLAGLQTRRAPERLRVLGLGARSPRFALPQGFQVRLGRLGSDFHFSGWYPASGKRIGYLRIPHFSPPSLAQALRELSGEVTWMNDNTDGLVVDVTNNTGGGCYGAAALTWLIPWPFQLPGDEVRATQQYVNAIEAEKQAVERLQPPQWVLILYDEMLKQLRSALMENRGRTGRIPFCGPSFDWDTARNENGDILAYRKPLITLVDDFTISWGDVFASAMQDAGRGPLAGIRTNGAGGSVGSGAAGFYSESFVTYTMTMGVRHRYIGTDDFGTVNYLENVGVRPEIALDYQTVDNLLRRGEPYVQAFTAAILAEISRNQ